MKTVLTSVSMSFFLFGAFHFNHLQITYANVTWKLYNQSFIPLVSEYIKVFWRGIKRRVAWDFLWSFTMESWIKLFCFLSWSFLINMLVGDNWWQKYELKSLASFSETDIYCWFLHRNHRKESGSGGCALCNSRILSSWLGDIIDSGIGFSYRPASSLAGRYDNPIRESISPPIVWRAGTTTLCQSRFYPSDRG